jgi:prepilin-type N-terminal cleavage/methylation domain-containing protein
MNRTRVKPNDSGGFTLIEIAIALFLIAVITTAGVKLLTSQAENAAYTVVAKKQETIRQALVTYLGKYKRLPCPDNQAVPDGNESRTTAAPAACVANFGRVPYATLGLSREAALDGWDGYFSYALSPTWSLTLTAAAPVANVAQTNVAAAAFKVGSVGALTVHDRSPANNTAVTVIANPVTGSGAVALLISHGKNGLGAYTIRGTQITPPAAGSDEAENINGANTIYFKRDPTDTEVPTYGAFDDIVMVLSANDLIGPLIRDGVLKSSEATVTEQLATIRDAAIGRITAACAMPVDLATLNLPPLTLIDPWGQPVQYATAGPALSTLAPQAAGAVAFKLWSRGPNQGDDAEGGTAATCLTTTDNACLTITYDGLRARIPPPACP